MAGTAFKETLDRRPAGGYQGSSNDLACRGCSLLLRSFIRCPVGRGVGFPAHGPSRFFGDGAHAHAANFGDYGRIPEAV
jgi:hypothetical protein